MKFVLFYKFTPESPLANEYYELALYPDSGDELTKYRKETGKSVVGGYFVRFEV